MSARDFGFAIGHGGRIPTVREYEGIDLMREHGVLGAMSHDDQRRAVAYLEGPIGRLLCALKDAEDAAIETDTERGLYVAASVRGVYLIAAKMLDDAGREPVKP